MHAPPYWASGQDFLHVLSLHTFILDVNFNPFTTCGVLIVAVLAIMACYMFDVEPLKCFGTPGLIAIAMYIANNYYTVADLSYQVKVSILYSYYHSRT